jgi:hypothetical protein
LKKHTKPTLLFLILAGVPILDAWGLPDFPPSAFLSSAGNIFLVRVSSSTPEQVTFLVTEILKGKPQDLVKLIPVPKREFKKDSEWVLMDLGSFNGKGQVGTLLSGDHQWQWLPAEVVSVGDVEYMKSGPSSNSNIDVVLKKLPDGSEGLPLEFAQKYTLAHPAVP